MSSPAGPPMLLEVSDLRVSFERNGEKLRAVDGLSFEVRRGETLALVGESGCGKTVTALSILRLVPAPGRIEGGRIRLEGRDLLSLGPREIRDVRGDRISMVFQDPMTFLNPVLTVGGQIAEVLHLHRSLSRGAARARALELLGEVAIPAPALCLEAYPHQLSAGMKQRALLAMALACDPVLLVADEPTTALDVTVQAQILDLIRSVQARSGMSVLFITHDLGVVAEVADRVVVMYAGRAVETAPVGELFDRPSHPYTLGLLQSLPGHHAPGTRLRTLSGEVPSPLEYPSGCRFHPRCPLAVPACSRTEPPPVKIAEEHFSACIRIEDGRLPPEQ